MESNILAGYKQGQNFWTANPIFRRLAPFKRIHEVDRSHLKIKSSKIMWGLAYFVEVRGNEFYNMEEEEKKELIKNDIIEKKNFKWESYEEAIELWIKMRLTATERHLMEIEKKLDERSKYLRDTKYDESNASKLDNLLQGTGKIIDHIEALKNRILKEAEEEGYAKGGRKESASERKLI